MYFNNENIIDVFINPIDNIEDIINAYEIDSLRKSNNELTIVCNGLWNLYDLSFKWVQFESIIKVNSNLNIKVSKKTIKVLNNLICLINENLSLGYFGFSSNEQCIYFRHNISLRGANNLSAEQIEDFIDILIYECDKYFPAFLWLIQHKCEPKHALKIALVETLGEA